MYSFEEDDAIGKRIAIGPMDSYNKPYSEKCPHCKGAWHGQPSNWQKSELIYSQDLTKTGCPGAYATDEQVVQWRSQFMNS